MMNDKLSMIMTKDVVTVAAKDNLKNVRDIFLEHKLHHIPVTNGDALIGIITTADLWKMDVSYEAYKDMTVKDVMTTKMATLSPDDKVGVAAELFLTNRFHAVPIVGDDKKLLGIVSSFDIMLYNFKKEYPNQFD